MDLIYSNASRKDLGVLQNYELDLALGKDENDFECRIASEAHCCGAGFFLYIEGTEYGGIIDGITSDTATKEVTYSGRTWQGILNSKIIQPDSGADYLTVSGEANAVMAALLERLELSSLFEASAEDSGLTIKNYKMHRYIAAYDGICKMLASVGGKLHLSYNGEKVILSAAERHDYSTDEEFDSDQMDFRVKRNYQAVNHLICLGQGELADRLVIHLYVDENGNVSNTQTAFGLAEYAAVYDYGNAESAEELENGGKEMLSAQWKQSELMIDFDADADSYDVGDIVGARDNITGISSTAAISKKIVTIKNGQTKIYYEVGD